jgi:hypothetical protein
LNRRPRVSLATPRGKRVKKTQQASSRGESGQCHKKERVKMIRSFGLLPKKPGLSDEQFHRHWHNIFVDGRGSAAPLVEEVRVLWP